MVHAGLLRSALAPTLRMFAGPAPETEFADGACDRKSAFFRIPFIGKTRLRSSVRDSSLGGKSKAPLRSSSSAGNAVGNAQYRRAAQNVPPLRSIKNALQPVFDQEKTARGPGAAAPCAARAVFKACFRRRHFFEERLLEELDFVVFLELVFFAATFLEELVFLTVAFRLDVFLLDDFTDFLDELLLVEVTFLELLDEDFFSLDLE